MRCPDKLSAALVAISATIAYTARKNTLSPGRTSRHSRSNNQTTHHQISADGMRYGTD
jgi:hypothetical protein